MRLKLSAPVTLENLLPYDFKYGIYDKNTKKDWTNFLRKGGVSPVHLVELSHLLLLSVDMQDTLFKASEFAIINPGNSEEFRREHHLVCKDSEGLTLNLKMHYYRIPDSGGAFKVTIYSPYILLNKTGLDLSIRSKGFMQQAKATAGQPLVGDLRMSVIPTIAPFLLPRILPRLRKERPQLKLFLREETSDHAIESLHHGRADCVLLALPFATGEVGKAKICDDELYVAFPKDDPRDPPAEIPPAMIDEARLMLLEDGHCLKEHALAACNRPELRASATMIGTSLHTLVQMVDNGLGLTMLPKMAIDAGILHETNVVARPLKGLKTSREIALVWRANSPREEEFRILAGELCAG